MPRWSLEPSASRPTVGRWARHSPRRCRVRQLADPSPCASTRCSRSTSKPRCAPSLGLIAAFRARRGLDLAAAAAASGIIAARRSGRGLRGGPDRGPARRCVLRRQARARVGGVLRRFRVGDIRRRHRDPRERMLRRIRRARGGGGRAVRGNKSPGYAASEGQQARRRSSLASPRCCSSPDGEVHHQRPRRYDAAAAAADSSPNVLRDARLRMAAIPRRPAEQYWAWSRQRRGPLAFGLVDGTVEAVGGPRLSSLAMILWETAPASAYSVETSVDGANDSRISAGVFTNGQAG